MDLNEKLTRRGEETWTGKVIYYIAADGTKFYTPEANPKRYRRYSSREVAKAAAKQHSINVIKESYPGIDYIGGQWLDDQGNTYSNWGSAVGGLRKETIKEAGLEEAQAEYKTAIEAAGEEETAYAEKLGARKFGVQTGAMQRALLGAGEDPARIQAITGRAQAGQQRFLEDIVQKTKAKTLGQLAGAEKFDIESGFTLQDLLSHEAQWRSGQQLEREKIQAQLDMQPGWWESLISSFGGGAGQGAGAYLMKFLMRGPNAIQSKETT